MRLIDFLVAEDIRTEVGDKHTVIGVLGDAMTIAVANAPASPLLIRLGLFVRIEMTAADPEAFKFECPIFWNDKHVAGFGGGGGRTPGSGAILTLPLVASAILLPIGADETSGDLRFNLTIRDAAGTTMLSEQLRPLRVTITRTPALP